MIGSGRKTFSGGVTLSYSYKNLTFRNQTSIGSNKKARKVLTALSAIMPASNPIMPLGRMTEN